MSMASSNLFFNSVNISAVKLGNSDVIMYLGEELVYPLSSVEITYDAATYNGVLQTAQNIVVTDKSGNTLVENVDYVVTENNGGINAGNYPLKVTLMGQYIGRESTYFVIDKVTPTVTAPTAINDLVYDSTAQALIYAGSTDYGTLKYSIDGVNYSTEIPSGTTVGAYTVYYKVDGDSNVNDVAAQSVACSINYAIITGVFNVTDTSAATIIASKTTNFAAIEIDGIEQPSVISAYTFSTTGEHTIKYGLTDDTIYNGTFQGCSGLTSIDIPDNINRIIGGGAYDSNGAFASCVSLTSVTIGSGITIIDNHTFLGCINLKRLNSNIDGALNIPSGVTRIGWGAFQNCRSITSIDIPNSVISIDGNAFIGCRSLTSIIIPDNVIRMGGGSVGGYEQGVFRDCSGLTSVTIGSGITSIVEYTFANCSSLTSIDIPNSVTSIGFYAFDGCSSLTSITIPDSVTSIGTQAFNGCTSLTSVTIPDSVTTIGYEAFYNCSGLTSITSNATTAPTIQSSTFYNVKTNGTLYVPIGSSGYDVWMGTSSYYLGRYNWTKVEQ